MEGQLKAFQKRHTIKAVVNIFTVLSQCPTALFPLLPRFSDSHLDSALGSWVKLMKRRSDNLFWFQSFSSVLVSIGLGAVETNSKPRFWQVITLIKVEVVRENKKELLIVGDKPLNPLECYVCLSHGRKGSNNDGSLVLGLTVSWGNVPIRTSVKVFLTLKVFFSPQKNRYWEMGHRLIITCVLYSG